MRANKTIFSGPNLTIYGDNNKITGPNCTVTGNNNKITGPNCTVHGNNNKLSGPNCTAHGDNNTLSGPNCKAYGNNNKITGPNFGGDTQINVGGDDGVTSFSIGGMRFNNFGGGGGLISTVGDGGSVVVNMSPSGGMRVFKNGVEQEPFMTSKKDKKKKKKKSARASRGRKDEDEPEIKFIEGPSKAELVQDKEAADNAPTCIICLTNVPCCIATPCNHLSFCVSCARALCFSNVEDEMPKQVGQQACPKCKKQVDKITRVFE